MSKLNFLKDYFDLVEFTGVDYAYITNHDNGRKISVYYEYIQSLKNPEGSFEQYTFMFETQHVHFENTEQLISCIQDYINEKLVAIEFYKNGKNSCGGQISSEWCDNPSIEKLTEIFGRRNILCEEHLTFETKSWSGKYDISAKIEKIDGEFKICPY